jgi:hypothetical protein
MTKYYYSYNQNTFEYIGKNTAYLDPEETRISGYDVYTLPAFASFEEPPKISDNQVIIYDKENFTWKIEPDYRGMYQVNEDMEPEEVKNYGELPEGYIPITEAQALKIEEDPLYYVIDNNKLVINPEYNEIRLEQSRQAKYAENDQKASECRYNQEFTIMVQNKECVFDTSDQTQRDLLTAFAVCSDGTTYDGWITNNGVELDLTLEDVALISQTFKEKSSVYGKWNEYRQEIDEATTYQEVERIVINYVD